MRDVLSDLILEEAQSDNQFVMLSGDHGYALFDAIRANRPAQFINVGIAEQNMIGIAAGLAKVGFRPCVYGLAAFLPIRVLEQIKLDLCHAGLAVVILGDGAGLVYSTLGVSHQCGEDIACLRPLPAIAIYSPCDAFELIACWREAQVANHPCYIRLGKADRPPLHHKSLADTSPVTTYQPKEGGADTTIIATGSMVSPCTAFAKLKGTGCISVPRIKPFPEELLAMVDNSRLVVIVEEHCVTGGLWTSFVECAVREFSGCRPLPRIESLALKSAFTESSGSWQHALAEHRLDDDHLFTTLHELCFRNE